MSKFLKALIRDERGVSAMEYAVLAGIIVVALAAAGATFSTSVASMFTTMFSNVKASQTTAAGTSTGG